MNRSARSVPLVLLTLAILGVVAPRTATASRYVVDPNGGGDFTSIHAAIDAQSTLFRDSVIVLPGAYGEALELPPPIADFIILGRGGPDSTSVLTIQAATVPRDYGWVRLEGLAFTGAVSLSGQALRTSFRRCAFRGEVELGVQGDQDPPQISECSFFARTKLQSLLGYVRDLHFHGAPLYVTHSYSGTMYMKDCTFEGPADTLVYMPWAAFSDPGYFLGCVFSNAANGLVYGGENSGGVAVSAGLFHDLSGIAISCEDTMPPYGQSPAACNVEDSRFERCGTAVRWCDLANDIAAVPGPRLVRDTILASTRDGIVLGPGSLVRITDCIIEGSGGAGAVVLQTQNPTNPYDANQLLSFVEAVRSRFTHNRGDGLVITDQDTIPEDPSNESWWSNIWPLLASNWAPQKVDSCVFTENVGAGLRIVAPEWRVTHSIALGNGGDGFALGSPDEGLPNRVASNTSSLNRGVGFRVGGSGSPSDFWTCIQNNLAVLNAGAGFAVPQHVLGSLAYNDAWQNYLGQYVGVLSPADSNLTVDPRFCDLSAGLAGLGLQQGSPCGPSGVYGLIGARPEECANVTAVPPPPTAGTLAFAVRPSVARGSVEFAAPAGGEGRVAVYDLAGRVLWRSPLGGAHASVRWNGEGANGRLSAGLYWVRFTRGAESTTQRLVWLE